MCVYNSVVEDNVDGFLAKTDEEWISNIEKLISDENLRKNIRDNALNKVLNDYLIKDRVKLWDDILLKLHG